MWKLGNIVNKREMKFRGNLCLFYVKNDIIVRNVFVLWEWTVF